jgi:hypothetical protein
MEAEMKSWPKPSPPEEFHEETISREPKLGHVVSAGPGTPASKRKSVVELDPQSGELRTEIQTQKENRWRLQELTQKAKPSLTVMKPDLNLNGTTKMDQAR